ncbi:hypothetical protein KUTeg_005005 [Tegillarca granosa]|uniref:EGF-like domain-containing protein n=1 Tax=Tegillarca granosa TaxID=220873 RepID=A0ABQ9FKB7_TEGGR|nr:hypothetical protein KUTeg_005005 [Tegillarca granosa]
MRCLFYNCCYYYVALQSYYFNCENGGTCNYNGTHYECLCNQGWDPTTRCQTVLPCWNVTCYNGGTCMANGTEDYCLCNKGLDPATYCQTGSIPNDKDVHNLTACLRDQDNACTTNLSVLVKKCDAYIIFYLSPTPTCNSTYCFDKASTWTPTSMHISFNMTWTNTGTAKPGIVYRCNFRFSTGSLWYMIKWYINDIKVTESEYVQKDFVGIAENTTLTEKYIATYGVTIKCSVTAVYSIMSPPGVETKSPGFYAGMKTTSDISVAYSHLEREQKEIL